MRGKKVFLSYASADQEIAREIAASIGRAGYEVWMDDEIAPGENFARRVGKALEESDAMVVLVSPAAAESEWVHREIEYAISSERFAGRLIPVVVRPTTKLPWILESLRQVRLAGDPLKAGKHVVDALREATRAG